MWYWLEFPLHLTATLCESWSNVFNVWFILFSFYQDLEPWSWVIIQPFNLQLHRPAVMFTPDFKHCLFGWDTIWFFGDWKDRDGVFKSYFHGKHRQTSLDILSKRTRRLNFSLSFTRVTGYTQCDIQSKTRHPQMMSLSLEVKCDVWSAHWSELEFKAVKWHLYLSVWTWNCEVLDSL